MNDILQTIIKCPNCTATNRKDNVNLGSISSDGYVILKRQFGRYTMVMAEEYSIICDCGYFIRIEHGKITASAPTVQNRLGQ